MKKTITILFFLATNFLLHAQITFEKAYGGSNVDGSWSVQLTSDGGYIITAESQSFGPGADAVYLIKTDSAGTIQWTKTFGGITADDYGNMVHQTIDGGYIIAGLTRGFGMGNGDYYVIKTDSLGNCLWSKTYGGANTEEAFSIQQTSDLGYIIAGYTESFGAGQADCYLIKTDSIGDTLWTKTYGGINNEGIAGFGNISVHQTIAGGYIIADYTNSFGAGGYDFYLIRTDINGNLIWSKTFGGPADEYGYGNNVGQTGDGGFIIVGLTHSFGSGNADVYLVKTDANGNLLWSKTYGGANDDYGYSVQQTIGGGFIITGATHSFGSGSFDLYLIKTDLVGNLLWSKTYGGALDDFGYSVQRASDSGFVMTGYTNSFGAGASDVYLIKTDANGNTGCTSTNPATIVTTPATQSSAPATIVSSGCFITTPATLHNTGGIETNACSSIGIQTTTIKSAAITIFPNPSSSEIQINYFAHQSEKISLTIINSLGEKVTEISLQAQSGKNNFPVDISSLANGMYFMVILDANGTQASKFLKE